ncbi:MAG: transposase [Dissulfuribacterales bacterium]
MNPGLGPVKHWIIGVNLPARSIIALNSFVKRLERHRYGILNHCEYPVHTGKLEGVNNKIKVIKRKVYGFYDVRYFELKIYQAVFK